MANLSRRWRKLRGGDGTDDDDKFLIPTRDDFQPIDTQAQEELLRSYELKHAQQNSFWRYVFAVFIMCFALFLLFSIINQALYPWEMRFHAYFMDEVGSWSIISAESLAVIVCLMACKGFVHHNQKPRGQWMWYSCYIGILVAVFWLYYMLRMPRFRWDVIWLPLAPLSLAGICLYVEHVLAESLEEIKKLRGYMYNYKTM